VLLGLGLQPLVGYGAIDLLFLVPVVLSASLQGLGGGLLETLCSALAYNFFFLPPIHTFTITESRQLDLLHRETRRLARFFADLVDMTRVEANALAPRIEPVDLTDAAAAALADMEPDLAGHAVSQEVPATFPSCGPMRACSTTCSSTCFRMRRPTRRPAPRSG
jgi:K+-sensing histidine kinase KdpD